jgi:branched-chain amino acid transport system permease protein
MHADRSSVALVVALAGSLMVAGLVSSPYYAGLVLHAATLGLLAISVNVVFGYLGYVSFGHAAFFGLGAYAAGLLSAQLGWNYWAALPLALVPGVLLGMLVGVASLRLGGAYFAIASLTVAEILRLLAANWIGLTRGPLGIVVLPAPLPGTASIGISPQAGVLAFALCLTAVVVFVLWRLLNSPYGRAWSAIRHSLPLAESIGIPTLRFRVACIGLSGGIASLAGTLFLPKIFVLTPDLFGASYSATALLAVVLGGRGTLLGPLLGGAVFAWLPEGLRSIEHVRLSVFAALLLLTVRLLPGGVVSVFQRSNSATPRTRLPEQVVLPVPTAAVRSENILLSVSGLSKSYGGLQALRNVSFELRQGEVLGLIGPNGAGKTTCLGLLAGALDPTHGSITFNGASVVGASSHAIAARGMARTFQATTLFSDLTVHDNVLLATHLIAAENPLAAILRSGKFLTREAEREAFATSVLHRVGLAPRADAAASTLSYGEQRLLAIALALALNPLLVLLDEPAAGLNHSEAMELVKLLQKLRAEGVSIIIIDHNLKMMMSVCDRIVVLHHGEKLAEGPPLEVRRNAEVIRAYLGGADAGIADAVA